jgi:hypothetical protein
MKPVLIAMALALLLAGCPPGAVTIKTVTLSPSQVTGSNKYWWWNSWACGEFVPGDGLVLLNDGPGLSVGPGESYSGFEDDYLSTGSCEQELQQLYRGQVQFDLTPFDNIVSATLSFNVERSITENGGVNDDSPPVSYATILGFALFPSQGDNGTSYYWDFANPVSLPSCGSLLPCPLDVSPQARVWAAMPGLNNGFILAGPRLDFPSNPKISDGNVTWYNNFQLLVVYNPAQNPRAPQ